MNKDQLKRVHEELKAVGVGRVGLHTPESKEIVRILHPDEHIGGVVYGRYDNGLAWIVATDRRVIFMDIKPLFSTTDELTYDVVSGIKSSKAGPFTAVTLHTRVSDYSMAYVPAKCASIFVDYIEKRRLESGRYDQSNDRYTEPAKNELPIIKNENTEAAKFLKAHDTGVLSTIDRTGNVHGAVIYYMVAQSNYVFILTKAGTGKARNVFANNQVALTIYEPGTMQTLQLQGNAEVETNQMIKEMVFEHNTKPRKYSGKEHLPPVTKLKEGEFMVIKITPTLLSFHDYAKTV